MEVTAENLLLVDEDGRILEGEGPAQGAAIALHAPIHRELGARGKVIFHTHQPWFTALSCIKTGGLRMFHPDACIYEGRVGFEAHQKTEHFQAWEVFASSDPFTSPPVVEFYEEM